MYQFTISTYTQIISVPSQRPWCFEITSCLSCFLSSLLHLLSQAIFNLHQFISSFTAHDIKTRAEIDLIIEKSAAKPQSANKNHRNNNNHEMFTLLWHTFAISIRKEKFRFFLEIIFRIWKVFGSVKVRTIHICDNDSSRNPCVILRLTDRM